MSSLDLPEPPSSEAIHLRRRFATGPKLASFTLALKTFTPILGGGPVARSPHLPAVDIIRVPTLRGHLRFWWRALYGHAYVERDAAGSEPLARRERALWGGMGRARKAPGEPEAHACRSQVELRVRDVRPAGEDTKPVNLGSTAGYALWPARKGKDEHVDIPRWSPGLQFTLEVTAPEGEDMEQVRNAVRAWILFGGYGSRSRRGCGSVCLASTGPGAAEWLPASSDRAALRRLFGDVPLLAPEHAADACDMPLLRGARLFRGSTGTKLRDGSEAWLVALRWLREFRQGTEPAPAGSAERVGVARKPGEGNRAGRSNWPEADKIRRFAQPAGKDRRGGFATRAEGKAYPEVHAPRPQHSATAAWSRAGFGLPIVFQFQQKRREDGANYQPKEPEDVKLQWELDGSGKLMDRLASPLIVKALPLADGRFEPIALWLERGTPSGGHVVMTQRGGAVPRTRVPFERSFRAQDDQPLFQTLQRADNLRDAFFWWLEETRRAQEA
ncbi:RAMP superfamily CRISPR-associated protein [Myxococcus sp. Y35]|uniref:RAMP superfamily CRISPR-associated protein n=1 Tax=Pseudomyxococcus flavus TaxID=3115648 RepID=UPI003CE799CA